MTIGGRTTVPETTTLARWGNVTWKGSSPPPFARQRNLLFNAPSGVLFEGSLGVLPGDLRLVLVQVLANKNLNRRIGLGCCRLRFGFEALDFKFIPIIKHKFSSLFVSYLVLVQVSLVYFLYWICLVQMCSFHC